MITIKKQTTLIDKLTGDDQKIILVPLSINNSFNKGFAYEIALNFKTIKEEEFESGYGDTRKYGTIYPITIGNYTFVICYIHKGGYTKETVFLDYDYLRSALKMVNDKYKGKTILSPIIGSSQFDGNGEISKIIHIFSEECKDVNVELYDFQQEDYKLEMFKKISKLHKRLVDKELSITEYIKERSKIEWLRTNGILEPMPENFIYIPHKNKKRII